MSVKVRNWLLAGMAIAVFILGTPLAQRVLAGGAATAEDVQQVEAKSLLKEHAPVVRLGEQYLRIVPMNDGSVGALLYDSSFKMIAANENEAALTFTLPGGEKKTVKITVPSTARCSMEGHSAVSDDCCAAMPAGKAHENCDHEQKTKQQ